MSCSRFDNPAVTPASKKQTLDQKRRGTPALVTGASSGLGRELAILFSSRGHVIISGRNNKALEETRQLCANPANISTVYGDLRTSDTRDRLGYFAHLYGVHYLICCAGAYHRRVLEGTRPIDVMNVLDTNITGAIKLIHEIYPIFANSRDGHIVHINSIAGNHGADHLEAVYAASKTGMAAFLKSLRWQARQLNIRVLDVFPGGIKTPMSVGR